MKRASIFLSAIFLMLGLLVPAQSHAMEAIAKELRGYSGSIIVHDSKSKKTCLIEKKVKDYQNHLDARLTALGMDKNVEAPLAAVLLITNESFALVGSHCAIHVDLSFQTRIPAEMFTRLSDAQRAALDRIGSSLPVKIWSASAMSVVPLTQPSSGGESDMAQKAVIRLIDAIVDLLQKQRG